MFNCRTGLRRLRSPFSILHSPLSTLQSSFRKTAELGQLLMQVKSPTEQIPRPIQAIPPGAPPVSSSSHSVRSLGHIVNHMAECWPKSSGSGLLLSSILLAGKDNDDPGSTEPHRTLNRCLVGHEIVKAAGDNL